MGGPLRGALALRRHDRSEHRQQSCALPSQLRGAGLWDAWNLYGGHYVDLRVLTSDRLTTDELRRIGELARTEDNRPIKVRLGRDRLAEALPVPDS